jgi:hypothetical protein
MAATSTTRSGLVPALALLCCGAAVAQAPRWERVDGPGRGPVVYDVTRNRLVAVDQQGSTFEWTGAWNRVPVTGPTDAFAIVHDPVHRTTIALGNTSLSIYDGTAWSPFAAPVAITTMSALAFDAQRGRLVALTTAGTWEHDGSAWNQTAPVAPATRLLTYDPVRQRVVAFGSLGASGLVLLAYDGVAWSPLSPTGPQSGSFDRTLGFDPGSNNLILHGDNSTYVDWEWNGAGWSSFAALPVLHPSLCATPVGLLSVGDNAPGSISIRVGTQWPEVIAGERADALRGLAVDLLANRITAVGLTTAQWDGSRWHTLPAATPFLLTTVVDTLRGRLLGIASSAAPAAWNGAWNTAPTPATTFSFRQGPSCAFDPVRDRVLVFGGSVPNSSFQFVPTNELWSWDGLDWTLAQGTVGWPAPRRNAGIAYDPVRQVVVLAAGVGLSGDLADTWEWNGSTWTQLTPASATFAGAVAMVFDPVAAQPVVAKGRGASVDLYAHDGVNWVLRSSLAAEAPVPPLNNIELAFEPGTGRMLLSNGAALLRLSAVSSHVEVQAAGCGAPIRLGARAVPRVGAPSTGIDIYGASGPALLGIASSPANVALGGGCTLLLGTIDLSMLLTADSNGFATQPLPVPALPAFLGLTVYAQAGQLDAASPIGIALSPRLLLSIGE